MSKRISGRNSHSSSDTHDHSEFTGTDFTQSDDTIKRAQDVNLLTEEIKVLDADTFRIELLCTLKEMNLNLKVLTAHMEEITNQKITKECL